MRTTNSQIAGHVLYDLQNVAERLQATQRKLSTGKEINQVEDNPVGAGRAMFLRNEVGDLKQYQMNVGEAQGWLGASDGALSAVQEVMQRAKVLVTQASNGTVDQTGLNAIAAEMSKLVDAARENMNATFAGRYLFAGSKTLTQPYPAPATAYVGDANSVQRVIGQGELLGVNLTGPQAFDGPSGQNPLQLLTQITTDLQSGNRAAIANGDLSSLESALDQISGARAEVGSRVNRLETQDARLKDLTLNVEELLSNTENADMARTMVDYSQQQALYQSALQSGARVVQPSLLDFLH
jgi:flagellar hook-associated protein 3 FlgL